MLRDPGYDARRGQQFCGGPASPDLLNVRCRLAAKIEVKRVQNLNLTDTPAQAEGDSGSKP